MWLIGEFEPVTLFSLRPSYATASGGQSLLTPTPFAVKMALLDACCRVEGLSLARQRWVELRALEVAIRPAAHAVISRTFQRTLKPRRTSTNDPEEQGPFQRTIAYREYVHFAGSFSLALGWDGEQQLCWLENILVNVTYLGKRGSFVQLRDKPRFESTLPGDFILLTEQPKTFPINGTMQTLDDCRHDLDFDAVNIYNKDAALREEDRPPVLVVLPYQQRRSTRSFVWYERIQ